MPAIINPGGERLPDDYEIRRQFARVRLGVESIERHMERKFPYPAVTVLASDGHLYNLDLLNGGGTMWEYIG